MYQNLGDQKKNIFKISNCSNCDAGVVPPFFNKNTTTNTQKANA